MRTVESIREKLKARDDISLVFVHGIAVTYYDWIKTVRTISGNKFRKIRFVDERHIDHDYDHDRNPSNGNSIWTASYYTTDIVKESVFGDLDEYARRLGKIIDLIRKLTGRSKVSIIAHSMGGLISRKYMTLSEDKWNSTHKILTLGTPNEGVKAPIGVVGQLIDLKENSVFINGLKSDWDAIYDTKKWGVIGAVDRYLFPNYLMKRENMIDSAGPGYVAISSAIPNGEWKDALSHMNKEKTDTEHFGFRMAIHANHWHLLHCEATYKGIDWALT
jgi:pimeloyl-ACP methyl ester carboxylesterase